MSRFALQDVLFPTGVAGGIRYGLTTSRQPVFTKLPAQSIALGNNIVQGMNAGLREFAIRVAFAFQIGDPIFGRSQRRGQIVNHESC